MDRIGGSRKETGECVQIIEDPGKLTPGLWVTGYACKGFPILVWTNPEGSLHSGHKIKSMFMHAYLKGFKLIRKKFKLALKTLNTGLKFDRVRTV